MKAMTLLGINCGLGNQDVALLRKKNIDMKKGWLDFPRPKTGIPRRVPLWAETIAAIRRVVKIRKRRKEKAAGQEAPPEAAVGTDTPQMASGRIEAATGSISPAGEAAKPEDSAACGRRDAKPGSISHQTAAVGSGGSWSS